MYIQLYHRHHGVHSPIKHMKIDCNLSDVYFGQDHINEELLLEHIPAGWLPVAPDKILLTVGSNSGSTGQCNLGKFMSWSKYFDSYMLELIQEPLDWWYDI